MPLKISQRLYVGAKVCNSVLLTLAGYSFGQKETIIAVIITCLYAGCKTFVEITEPNDKS